MSNFPGETFVSKGIEYMLQIGPKGNLRPYYLGPVIAPGGPYLWIGLAIAMVVGVVVLAVLCDDDAGGTKTDSTPL